MCTHNYEHEDVKTVINPANTCFSSKGEWIVQSSDGSPVNIQLEIKTHFPWMLNQVFQQCKTVLVSKIEDLPPEAHHDVVMFRRFGTKADVIIPLVVGGES